VLLMRCHPFDYLCWLLDEIEHLSATLSRCDRLGLSADTCVDVTACFGSGASMHFHLSFVERLPKHQQLTARLAIGGARIPVSLS
jgi:predicted dehydrogenase